MVVHASGSNMWEAEAGELPSMRTALGYIVRVCLRKEQRNPARASESFISCSLLRLMTVRCYILDSRNTFVTQEK